MKRTTFFRFFSIPFVRPTSLAVASALGAMLLAATLGACGTKTVAPPPPAGSPPEVMAGYNLALKRGCFSCHSVTGAKSSGGTLKGLAGSQVPLVDGTTVMADDDYLKKALTEPDVQIRKGYNKGVMSSAMKNQAKLTDQQLNDLVAYMKSLK